MGVKFDLFESPRLDSNAYRPKPHPKVISKGVVNSKNLSERIQKQCTVTPADIAGVLTALSQGMSEALKDGCSVHIDGIGYFSLNISCVEDINEKHVRNSDIILRGVNFSADKELMNQLSVIKFEHDKDISRHSEILTDDEVYAQLKMFFDKNTHITRKEFQDIMHFNQTKATRYIRRLISEFKLKNVGARFQPLYVRGENL